MTQLTSPTGPAGAATVDSGRWWALGVLCTTLVLITVDTTILNVAIPTLSRSLATSTSELQWIVDAYTVVFAALLLTAGNLGDRLGRRRMLAAGLVVFGMGCVGSALAQSAGALIAMRAITGVGAALIFPATLSIITNLFTDPVERQKAIAVWASTAGIGIALGPLAGGILLEHFYWGSIFLVNLPVIVLALVGLARYVPESRDPVQHRLDLLGALLSIVGLSTLVYGIIEGGSAGWGAPRTVVAVTAGLAVLALLVYHESRTRFPMVDLAVFRNPRFAGASIAVTAVYFCLFGTIFLLTQHLQELLGYGTLAAGIRTVPFAVVLMIVANLTPRIVGRVGPRLPIVAGLVVVAGSQLLRIASTPTSGYGIIFASQVVFAFGMGLLIAPATASIMGSVPPTRAGMGSAINDTTRQVGGALGVAVMGSVAAAGFRSDLVHRVPHVAASARDSLAAALDVATSLGRRVGASRLVEASQHAFIHGLRLASWVAFAIALIGAAFAWRLLPGGRALASTTTTAPDASVAATVTTQDTDEEEAA
jgi:EmrB/QacA subfamily drug resistance transporter